MILNDSINSTLLNLGIYKCEKASPEYFNGNIPELVSELFLGYSWPKSFQFKFNKSGPWFTNDKEALNNIYEFSPQRFEEIKGYYNLASDQSYFLCVKDEEPTSNPKLYLVDYEELISSTLSRGAILAGYTYKPDEFTLEWFLENIKVNF